MSSLVRKLNHRVEELEVENAHLRELLYGRKGDGRKDHQHQQQLGGDSGRYDPQQQQQRGDGRYDPQQQQRGDGRYDPQQQQQRGDGRYDPQQQQQRGDGRYDPQQQQQQQQRGDGRYDPQQQQQRGDGRYDPQQQQQRGDGRYDPQQQQQRGDGRYDPQQRQHSLWPSSPPATMFDTGNAFLRKPRGSGDGVFTACAREELRGGGVQEWCIDMEFLPRAPPDDEVEPNVLVEVKQKQQDAQHHPPRKLAYPCVGVLPAALIHSHRSLGECGGLGFFSSGCVCGELTTILRRGRGGFVSGDRVWLLFDALRGELAMRVGEHHHYHVVKIDDGLLPMQIFPAITLYDAGDEVRYIYHRLHDDSVRAEEWVVAPLQEYQTMSANEA